MAQGRSNGAIAGELVVTERAVEKHVTSIFISWIWLRRRRIIAGCWRYWLFCARELPAAARSTIAVRLSRVMHPSIDCTARRAAEGFRACSSRPSSEE